jgi:hypothetical protein
MFLSLLFPILQYPIPQGFDLGPPDVGALQVTLSSHFGALASAVNQYKLPDAALQFINYDTGLQDERSGKLRLKS